MVYTSEYPIFYVTVDVVVLTARDGVLSVLAVQRGEEPFQGRWALPGGFVNPDEDLAAAAVRELEEETGVSPGSVRLEQIGAFGQPDRDPRHRVVSVAYLAVLPEGPPPRAGSDAAGASWVPVDELLGPDLLAFDHRKILTAGVQRITSWASGSAPDPDDEDPG